MKILKKFHSLIILTISLSALSLAFLSGAVLPNNQDGSITSQENDPPPITKFYEGNIRIDRADIQVFLSDENARFVVNYKLANTGQQAEEVVLSFFSSSFSLTDHKPLLETKTRFEPRKTLEKPLEYSLPISGTELRGVKIDPQFLANNQHLRLPMVEYRVSVTLPRGVRNLVKVGRPPSQQSSQNGLVILTWIGRDTYFSPIDLAWSTVGTVQIKKTVPEVRPKDGVIEVKLSIANPGNDVLRDILLQEDFNPGDFEPVAPLDEFRTEIDKPNDIRLIWQQTINNLSPGETIEITYKVKLLNTVTTQRFARTQAIVNGNLIGLSGDVYVRPEN